MMVDLANPKAAVFFTTVFSSLLPDEFGVGYGAAVLAVVAVVVSTWYLVVALTVSIPVVQQRYRNATRPINRVASTVVMGFAAKLALQP